MKTCNDMVNSLLERREQYETEKKRRTRTLMRAVTPVCCLCLVALLGVGVWKSGLLSEQQPQPYIPDIASYSEATALAHDDVWIYFVSDHALCREQEHLCLSGEEVFKAWKEKNGIDDEVELIKIDIGSNGKESTENVGGQSTVVHYEVGNYFVFNITVSKNLATCYDDADISLLLESLEQTMTGYSHMEYNEYHLILE